MLLLILLPPHRGGGMSDLQILITRGKLNIHGTIVHSLIHPWMICGLSMKEKSKGLTTEDECSSV